MSKAKQRQVTSLREKEIKAKQSVSSSTPTRFHPAGTKLSKKASNQYLTNTSLRNLERLFNYESYQCGLSVV